MRKNFSLDVNRKTLATEDLDDKSIKDDILSPSNVRGGKGAQLNKRNLKSYQKKLMAA